MTDDINEIIERISWRSLSSEAMLRALILVLCDELNLPYSDTSPNFVLVQAIMTRMSNGRVIDGFGLWNSRAETILRGWTETLDHPE